MYEKQDRLLSIMGVLIAVAFLPRIDAVADAAAQADAEYRQSLAAWRDERLAFLKGADGYLNLVGLFWLEPGESRFGSSGDNELRFPSAAAPRIGVLDVRQGQAAMTVDDGVEVRVNGEPVQRIVLSDDTTDNPVLATHGSLAWTIIRRDHRLALRLRDYEHPAIERFESPRHFPVDPGLRVTATLHRYATPRPVRVQTVIEGLDYRPDSPGVVRFEVDGRPQELEAYVAGDELFFVFGDRTNRTESYPAGRFLYAEMPDEAGETVLDFNKAHNPPCAFNEFATCPVASPRNRLAVAIAAGEMYDRSAH